MIEAKKVQQLDFNLLKVFECLYQERNMSVAAKLLFISPSAVSHAIKRLRLVLNDELFTRQGQLMQPTPACQRMAPQLLDTEASKSYSYGGIERRDDGELICAFSKSFHAEDQFHLNSVHACIQKCTKSDRIRGAICTSNSQHNCL